MTPWTWTFVFKISKQYAKLYVFTLITYSEAVIVQNFSPVISVNKIIFPILVFVSAFINGENPDQVGQIYGCVQNTVCVESSARAITKVGKLVLIKATQYWQEALWGQWVTPEEDQATEQFCFIGHKGFQQYSSPTQTIVLATLNSRQCFSK